MKICRSPLALTLAGLTVANAFVAPQHTFTRTPVSLEASTEDDVNVSVGDVMKGLAFTALFGFSMIANPLPSMADGM